MSLDHREYVRITQADGYCNLISCVTGVRDKRVLNLSGLICCFLRIIDTKEFCAIEVYDYFRLICKLFIRANNFSWVLDVGIGFLKSAKANFVAINVIVSLHYNAVLCLSRKRFLSLSATNDQDDLRSELALSKLLINPLLIRTHNPTLNKLITYVDLC